MGRRTLRSRHAHLPAIALTSIVIGISLLLTLLDARGAPPVSAATTFTVNNVVSDASDATPGNGVCATAGAVCTLRAAIQESNALAGTDTIEFGVGSGAITITPGQLLPIITAPTILNGRSQPGYSGVPIVTIDGVSLGGIGGIEVSSGGGGSTIQGLIVIRHPSTGIMLNSSSNNIVRGNYVGTNGAADLGNGDDGIYFSGTGNTIGGAAAEDRNVVSGNGESGIETPGGANGFTITNNHVGTNAAGTGAVANAETGITITNASGTISGNVVSANILEGIGLRGSLATGVSVTGNRIGTSADGSASLGNGSHGIVVTLGANSNVIGGATAPERNLISGNGGAGVILSSSGTNDNVILGNYIGTDTTGAVPLGNSARGVHLLSGASSNEIGTASAGNVISANATNNVYIDGVTTTGNSVSGNIIGPNAAGTASITSGATGVGINNAPGNMIGGSTAGYRNVISGGGIGVLIVGLTATGNEIASNYIGVDPTGSITIGNGGRGVSIFDATGTVVGGPGMGNVISGNGSDGVFQAASGTMTGLIVQGNFIGTDATGTADLGNSNNGIALVDANGNTIGGTQSGAGNLVSGNNFHGIVFAPSSGNTVQGNLIGTTIDATTGLGNAQSGIVLLGGSSNNLVGGGLAVQANVLSGNLNHGIVISGGGSTGNRVRGNSMFGNSLTAITNTSGGNNEPTHAPPTITAVDNGYVNGTACAFCLVDAYSDDADEGRIYQGLAVADGAGNWIFSAAVAGPNLTATATDTSGNTSMLSAPFAVEFERVGGTGTSGFAGDGGQAQLAQINGPRGLFETPGLDLFFADTGNNRIRTISPNEPTGIITTFAGGGSGCGGQLNAVGDGCTPVQAILSSPIDVVVAPNGDTYIADTNNCRIRKVAGGVITTVAGTGVCGYDGEGAATAVHINQPRGVSIEPVSGDLFIADTENHRVRKLTVATGMITTVAGTGTAGFGGDGGQAVTAMLNRPYDVSAGPTGLYIADHNNHRARRVAFGTNLMSTIAGNGTAGFSGDGGPGTAAQLSGPEALAVEGQDLVLIADTGNNRIRHVDAISGMIETAAGGGVLPPPATALDLQLTAPAGVSAGLTIANTGEHQIVGAEGDINPQTGLPGENARPITSCSQSPGSIANADFLMLLAPMGAVAGRKRMGKMIRLLSVWLRMPARMRTV